jgi:hypothetical protein
MVDARHKVRETVVEHVEKRSRQLARIYHVPFEDLLARYALSSASDGQLVVQIHYAGHLLDKVMLERDEWER